MIRFKSDVHHVFLEFQAHVECLLNRKIISVQSDWGGEYQCLNSYLKYVGIQHHIFAHIPTSRTVWPNANTGTLWRLA
jgi:hypothetical protein